MSRKSLYSAIQVEQIWTSPGLPLYCEVPSWTSLNMSWAGIPVQWNPSWTSLNMWGLYSGTPLWTDRHDRKHYLHQVWACPGDSLYSEVQVEPAWGSCMVGPPVNRQTDMTENITPLLRWRAVITVRASLHCYMYYVLSVGKKFWSLSHPEHCFLS